MLGKGSRIPSRGRSWWLTLGLLVLCAGSATAAGFHDSGVAACSYCHTMHGTRDGMPLPFGSPGGHALLVDTPPSDLCLNCHALSLGAVLADDPLMPTPERGPGNFVFLKSINLNDGADGLTDPIPGDRAGHNVRAPGHGLYSDATNIHAPGGTFPSRNLKCTSCHDPHGNQNYRMLRGVGQGAQGVFQYPAPLAEGLPFGSGQSESEGNHVAYQSGMSRWCGNCHPDYLHNDHGLQSSFAHPTDENMSAAEVQQYILYNGTADPTGGQAGTSYLAEVPYEDASSTPEGTGAPSVGSKVMCLSCHRAHASSAPHAGRWDFNVDALGQDGVISGSYPLPNPYPDPAQDPLCFKCHPSGGSRTTSLVPSVFSP